MNPSPLKPCNTLAPSPARSSMDPDEDNGAVPNPPSSAITNGAVSGVIPQSELFAVNYPGYPSSTSRAIDTLGGIHEIEKARSSDSGQLELRFRPEDPYCHPAFGERRSFAGLVLKISKTRPESDNDGKERLSAEVVARVNEAYDFEGMVDYQHVLAVHAAEARRKRRRCDIDEETDLGGASRMNLEEEADDVMMLVPPLFSLKNTPEEIVLNPPSNLFSKKLQKSVVEHRWEMDIEPCLAIDFDIEIPGKLNWEDKIPRGTTEWELQLAVSKLFEVRPIWPRRSIHEELLENGLQVTDHMLKRLLFRTGYYFSTGPFAQFWIKKGYDPRKDPESRKYQKIDFRVPSQLRSVGEENTDAGSKQTWKNICQFQVFPWKNFTCLQFFELDDDFIQDAIQKPTYQTTCTRSRGWFSDTLLRTLRLRVSMRFISLCPREGAEVLLQCIFGEFEKLKKLEALGRIRKSATKHQNPNKGSNMSTEAAFAESGGTEHQMSGQDGTNNREIENDQEDEGEEEEEEEEDEFAEYESQAVAGDDGRFSLETGSYQAGDPVVNDYLQDLLRELPFSKDGNHSTSNKELQNADVSDGEFQIYEQDSDDSDDDDDYV